MTTTTREAALEAALKDTLDFFERHSNRYDEVNGKHPQTIVDEARAALYTPATEPHGYVEGLEAAAQAVIDRWETPNWKDAEPTGTVIYALRAALAARPAPQPAADTRVGDGPKGGVRFAVPAGDTKEQMRNWLTNTKEGQSLYNTGDCLLVWANEGDLFQPPATPAPSDKIADAARDAQMVERIDDVAEVCRAFKLSEPHFRAALRALAGQGETP